MLRKGRKKIEIGTEMFLAGCASTQGFFLPFWEHGPWRLNWEFGGVFLKIGNF